MATPTPGTCDQCKATGLPLLPVRYAVAPRGVEPVRPPWASAERIAEIPLGDDYTYTLRTVRQGYLYLYYSHNARGSKQWECYTIWPDGSLHQQPDTQLTLAPFAENFPCSRQGHNPLGMHYIVIDRPERCGTTWIAFSGHKWSPEAIARYQGDEALRDARMQRIEPAAMAAGTPPAHGTLATANTLEEVLEYGPRFDPARLPYERSITSDFSTPDGVYRADWLDTAMSTCHRLNLRRGRLAADTVDHMRGRAAASAAHVLALWDAVGIVQELAGFRNDAAGWLKRFGDERALQISALHAIDGTREALAASLRRRRGHLYADPEIERLRWQAANRHARRGHASLYYPLKDNDGLRAAESIDETTYRSRRSALFQSHSNDPAAMEAVYADIDRRRGQHTTRVEEAAKREWQDTYERHLEDGAPERFRSQLTVLNEHAAHRIEQRTTALVEWLRAPLLLDTLEDFHPDNIEDGILFEDVVAEVLFGIGATPSGQALLQAWVNEGRASVRGNLLWRTVALNQTRAKADVDAALAYARNNTTPLSETAWNTALANLGNLKGLVEVYARAQDMLEGNAQALQAAGLSGFATRLGGNPARALDRLGMSAGEMVFRSFRIDRAGDYVGEKIIQYLFSLRAFVAPEDAQRLIVAQAREQAAANAALLRRMDNARAFMDLPAPEAGARNPSAALAAAWNALKGSEAGHSTLRSVRLSVLILLIETANFANLSAHSDASPRARAMLAASGMAMSAAVLDIAAAPAAAIWGEQARTFQRLKLWGGLLGGMASLVLAGLDLESYAEHSEGERLVLANLYLSKGIAGGLAGGLMVMPAFSHGFGVILQSTGNIRLATTVRSAGAAAGRVLGARILLMSFGAWLTVTIVTLQVVIWIFTPNRLEEWCSKCAFGKRRDNSWTADWQMKVFVESLQEVL